MRTLDHYQAIVIGSGQGGTPLCTALAEAGLRTALIERLHVGGTCVNEGCTPTKTMVASGRVAYLARRGPDYGIHTGDTRVDMKRVRQRKRDIVDSFRNGSQKRIEKTANLDLIFGEASFTGPKSVLVRLRDGGQRTLTGEKIFINAGARPTVPALDGLRDIPFLDSTSIMELDSVPEHLIVIGGGYVGLEFGQMFRRFGSHVTIVHTQAQLLPQEDTDVAREIEKILTEDGIDLLLESRPLHVSRNRNDIRLQIETHGGLRDVTGSHLLIATGRTPNTDSLNIKASGIEVDANGYIRTNAQLETNVSGVYALGDIKGGPAFTHISYDDNRVIRSNLLERRPTSITGRLVPYTVFIDPQLGRVGLTEAEAQSKGMDIKIAKIPMSRVARALEVDETRGFMKAVVDAKTQLILGVAVLGIEGGELMSMIQVAMMGRVPYTALRDGIFAHPTLAESLNNLFLAPVRPGS
jgi:pyruvate/2-oxoglutarate dehydrogenase complex dihydrolipoamide dehydrogenase (E3) component